MIFLRIAILTALLNTLSNPLIITMHASGKVRDYQIVVGFISLLTLPLVYTVLKLGAEPYWAMIVAFIVEIACHFARLCMLVRSIQFPMSRFLKDVTFRVYIITAMALVLTVFAYKSIGITLIRFLTVCVLSAISTLVLGYYLGFNSKDRLLIRTRIVNIVNNKILRREHE